VTSLLADAFEHHAWATEQLIDACAALTPAQLETRVPGTYGSIIKTLRHLVGTDRWYLSFFVEGDGLEPVDDEVEIGLDVLRAETARSGEAWARLLARDLNPAEDIPETEDEGVLHSPVGVRLAQVVHHGTDHRSQVCTALTSLGIEPPDIDVWAFARATGREWFEPHPAAS
jgi:uncharacterized damage-inducible protein DinB